MSGGKKQCKDRSITVRFDKELAGDIEKLAAETDESVSEIIRLATSNSLTRYLTTLRYVDQEQGRRISGEIVRLMSVMREIQYNLRRIGINFDQLLHRVNSGEIQSLQSRNELITKEDLDQMMTRMESVARQVGGDLHVFQN